MKIEIRGKAKEEIQKLYENEKNAELEAEIARLKRQVKEPHSSMTDS